MSTETRDTDSAPHPEAVKRVQVANRRHRTGVYGAVLFGVGLVAALVAMWVFESLAFASLWIAVAMVGGGFLAAGDIKGLLNR